RLPPPIDRKLTGKLPWWADKQGFRAALLTLDGGVRAAVSVPAAAYLGWLGRYQAFYTAALLGLFVFALVWGLLPSGAPAAVALPAAGRAQGQRPAPREEPPPAAPLEPGAELELRPAVELAPAPEAKPA